MQLPAASLNLLNGFLMTLELSLSSSSTSVRTPDLGRGYRPLSEASCEKAGNFGSIKTRSVPGVPPPYVELVTGQGSFRL